jgi:riboflavin synthase
MFTGIIQGCGTIAIVKPKAGLTSFAIEFRRYLRNGLRTGASVSVDGVCLTVAAIQNNHVFFDAMEETLQKTTIGNIHTGQVVNIERSYSKGQEIGGHIISGHVHTTAKIVSVSTPENNYVLTFEIEKTWLKYLFPKGFIAINGASLTIVAVNKEAGTFTVHFIPETLKQTDFSQKKPQDFVNIEIDSQTQIIVDTVERMLLEKSK